MALPEDLAPALTDGVVLCHLANHVKPRSVASIHVPSPAVVSLSLQKLLKKNKTQNYIKLKKKHFYPVLIIKFSLQPKLTMARCRRNVDNFLEACRKIGVDEVSAFSLPPFTLHDAPKLFLFITSSSSFSTVFL